MPANSGNAGQLHVALQSKSHKAGADLRLKQMTAVQHGASLCIRETSEETAMHE